MSRCSCDTSGTSRRISDEGIRNDRENNDVVRLRCTDCGGKAGWIPVTALEAFGYDREDIEQSAEPGPNQIHVNIGWKSAVPEPYN